MLKNQGSQVSIVDESRLRGGFVEPGYRYESMRDQVPGAHGEYLKSQRGRSEWGRDSLRLESLFKEILHYRGMSNSPWLPFKRLSNQE